ALGTAYQLYDDCVDLFGSEEAAGKSLGTDLAKGKLTLPVILALGRASASDREELHELVLHWHPDRLPRLRSLLDGYDTFNGTQTELHRFLHRARTQLEQAGRSESLEELTSLLDYLAQQSGGLGVLNQH
ncbi:MAG TPA: polyprenyl synthetase family protein, partial [Verrucomicrobiales bacterium]|nr:polyprenyl synthetase family protein [Verrucomicrobiales bacterium]